MTDKEYRQTRRRIKRICDAWIRPLSFGWFQITIDYWREGFGDEKRNIIARITSKWQYREAQIEWNMPKVKELPDEELEDTLLHELAHILLNEMEDYEDTERGRKHEEHVATGIALLIRSAHEKGLKDARQLALKQSKAKPRRKKR